MAESPADTVTAMGNRAWAAFVRSSEGLHSVVVDGLNQAGNVLIRDPWEGTAYETPMVDFETWWAGAGVFPK
jgi:hypothetical protein